MILCEMAEKKYKETEDKRADAQNKFRKSEELLLGALAGRIQNKADDQRLGDVYVWLGRTAVGLNQIKNATQYFEKSLTRYNNAFPKAPDAQDVHQIKDVRSRLGELGRLGLMASTSFGQGIFNPSFSSAVSPTHTISSASVQESETYCEFKKGFLIGRKF
jgi:hypothetical protein